MFEGENVLAKSISCYVLYLQKAEEQNHPERTFSITTNIGD